MRKKLNFAYKFARVYANKYTGKFVAFIDEKIVAIGKNRVDVYKKAKKQFPNASKIGIFYFPQKEELVTALCNFLTWK